MDLSLRDRLDARAFHMDELILRLSKAEHELGQSQARVKDLEARLSEAKKPKPRTRRTS